MKKSKKLIISLSVIVVFVAVVVILASVFSVHNVNPVYHSFDGGEILPETDAPNANDVLAFSKGKSMFFMSKDKLLADLNAKFPEWHAFAVVKSFPNILDVHFVKREAVVKIDIKGNYAYVDSFGYVTEIPADRDCIDISSIFTHRDTVEDGKGKQLKFLDEENNVRLNIVLKAIVASWQCNVELDDLLVIFGETDVFGFEDGNLTIVMRSGAKIIVVSPATDNLSDRIIKAYSVYYNEKYNLQQKGVEIIVEENGTIRTPNPNK